MRLWSSSALEHLFLKKAALLRTGERDANWLGALAQRSAAFLEMWCSTAPEAERALERRFFSRNVVLDPSALERRFFRKWCSSVLEHRIGLHRSVRHRMLRWRPGSQLIIIVNSSTAHSIIT